MSMARERRQLQVPGTETPERPEIEEPAEDLRAIQIEIATLNERKRNAKATLLSAMQAANVMVHKYLDADGVERVARVKEDPKVSVERVKAKREKPEADGGGGEQDVEVH